ncbi:MAG: hypothetical protein AAFR50_09575 [Pseudomonadota bacterium]
MVLLSRFSAVVTTQAAFLVSALTALALILAPGSAVLVLLFMCGLGIVQGASFAVVPELNESLEHRAQGNGALAQTGNIGNGLGTPVVAALLAGAGYNAMMASFAVALICGAMVHIWMARLRKFA